MLFFEFTIHGNNNIENTNNVYNILTIHIGIIYYSYQCHPLHVFMFSFREGKIVMAHVKC